jgi:hypothetical protein
MTPRTATNRRGTRTHAASGFPLRPSRWSRSKLKMEHGVLTVTVPKIKNNEHKDVFEIKIE